MEVRLLGPLETYQQQISHTERRPPEASGRHPLTETKR